MRVSTAWSFPELYKVPKLLTPTTVDCLRLKSGLSLGIHRAQRTNPQQIPSNHRPIGKTSHELHSFEVVCTALFHTKIAQGNPESFGMREMRSWPQDLEFSPSDRLGMSHLVIIRVSSASASGP